MLGEINNILLETAFPTKPYNIYVLTCAILSMLIIWVTAFRSVQLIFVGFLPFIIYMVVMHYFKYFRKERLLNCINEWNQAKVNGVFLSLGGSAQVRGQVVGSHDSGTYDHFQIATYDNIRFMAHGYLHVFVNFIERSSWCQRNGVPFVPPVTAAQQSMEQQLTSGQFPLHPASQVFQVQALPPGFQVPAGYALVPQSQISQPPHLSQPQFQQPDLPPSYEDSQKY